MSDTILPLADRLRSFSHAADDEAPVRSHPAASQWAIVLAGGAGSRIAGLTTDANGRSVPKQFCSLTGRRSLLGDTLARAARCVPAQQVVTVVRQEHQDYWRRDLDVSVPAAIVAQPRDRGTAAGVLLPLLRILAQDPNAIVTLLPSDHFVGDEPALERAIADAQRAVAEAPERIVLLGFEPSDADSEYGWILPGRDLGGARSVLRFVEKPAAAAIPPLVDAGAVWNSGIATGSLWSFLLLFDRQLPGYLDAFLGAGIGWDSTAALYDRIAAADFSRDVLQGAESELGVLVVPECGWTDLGTPLRLAACARTLRQRGVGWEPGSLVAAVDGPGTTAASA